MKDRDDIIALLKEKDIEFFSEKHIAVYSIKEMEEAGVVHAERIAKNLFLRDDKKRSYYLVSIRNDRTADLKRLRAMLSSRPLSFASESDLEAILSLSKGEVTPFALLNDEEHRTVFVLDSFFIDGIIGIHPNDNRETVFLPARELLSILKENGISVTVLDFA